MSRPTTGAEQEWVRWLQCLNRKWSCVNHQFQFHTQIAYKPTYMTHDLCYLLPFIIGTDIKFNHTNSAIHSSGYSPGLFTSAGDYTSAQWRLVLHILVTCSPHVNKCWVTRAIYGIRCGWSHWPITIQHVRAQWGSVVSWRACSTESEKATRVSRSIGKIFNGLKNICKFWSLIKMHDLLMCNIIKMMPYNGYPQMLRVTSRVRAWTTNACPGVYIWVYSSHVKIALERYKDILQIQVKYNKMHTVILHCPHAHLFTIHSFIRSCIHPFIHSFT